MQKWGVGLNLNLYQITCKVEGRWTVSFKGNCSSPLNNIFKKLFRSSNSAFSAKRILQTLRYTCWCYTCWHKDNIYSLGSFFWDLWDWDEGSSIQVWPRVGPEQRSISEKVSVTESRTHLPDWKFVFFAERHSRKLERFQGAYQIMYKLISIRLPPIMVTNLRRHCACASWFLMNL